jgi:hypothetical protein
MEPNYKIALKNERECKSKYIHNFERLINVQGKYYIQDLVVMKDEGIIDDNVDEKSYVLGLKEYHLFDIYNQNKIVENTYKLNAYFSPYHDNFIFDDLVIEIINDNYNGNYSCLNWRISELNKEKEKEDEKSNKKARTYQTFDLFKGRKVDYTLINKDSELIIYVWGGLTYEFYFYFKRENQEFKKKYIEKNATNIKINGKESSHFLHKKYEYNPYPENPFDFLSSRTPSSSMKYECRGEFFMNKCNGIFYRLKSINVNGITYIIVDEFYEEEYIKKNDVIREIIFPTNIAIRDCIHRKEFDFNGDIFILFDKQSYSLFIINVRLKFYYNYSLKDKIPKTWNIKEEDEVVHYYEQFKVLDNENIFIDYTILLTQEKEEEEKEYKNFMHKYEHIHKYEFIRIRLNWNITRLLWIGNLKNRGNKECFISLLPKEIIREIINYL